MFRKSIMIATLLAALPALAAAQTVDDVIAKNIQARGGMDKLKSIKSIRMSGKMTVGPGIEAPLVMEQKRPASFRMEFTIQGMTGVQAYNGKIGWSIMPFGGKKDPEAMGEDELKASEEQADIDGPLVDYRQKGNTVELLGKESVEGTDAYKLKIVLKNGEQRILYLDADSYLEIKTEAKRTIRGTERESETIIGDYKEVEGMMMPHSIEVGVKGTPQKQKITVDKIEVNPTIDDSRFKMPEAKMEDKK